MATRCFHVPTKGTAHQRKLMVLDGVPGSLRGQMESRYAPHLAVVGIDLSITSGKWDAAVGECHSGVRTDITQADCRPSGLQGTPRPRGYRTAASKGFLTVMGSLGSATQERSATLPETWLGQPAPREKSRPGVDRR